MIKFAWDMYKKYEEAINYLFFGFLAFLVNMVAYALAVWVLGADDEKVVLVLASTSFAWVVAVLFAYWTNRTFVFKSQNKDAQSLGKEFVAFIGARVATEVLELALMFLMVDCASLNEYASKLVCQVIVILANYFLSKLWIFKDKK